MLSPGLSSCHVGKGALLPAGPKTLRHTAHCTTSHPLAHLRAHNQILKPLPALTGHLTSSFNTSPYSAPPQSYLNIFLPPGRCLRTGEGLNPLCHSPHIRTYVHIGTQIHLHIYMHTYSLAEGLPGPRTSEPVPGGQVRAVAEKRACCLS